MIRDSAKAAFVSIGIIVYLAVSIVITGALAAFVGPVPALVAAFFLLLTPGIYAVSA